MNEAQNIFTLFFAISWGVVSNVLPRWKPFHYAMWGCKKFPQPRRRIVAGWAMLNILPWLCFVVILVWLRADPLTTEEWNLKSAALLIPRSILPGMLPFAWYRIWMGVMQMWPTFFYAEKQEKVPDSFKQSNVTLAGQIEPDAESLHLNLPGATHNLFVGLLLLLFGLLALIPGTK